MLRLQKFKLYFKYVHKYLPPYLVNWRIMPSINTHNYNTREKIIYILLEQARICIEMS